MAGSHLIIHLSKILAKVECNSLSLSLSFPLPPSLSHKRAHTKSVGLTPSYTNKTHMHMHRFKPSLSLSPFYTHMDTISLSLFHSLSLSFSLFLSFSLSISLMLIHVEHSPPTHKFVACQRSILYGNESPISKQV